MSLCLCLYSCLANRFISTIFLDSIYMPLINNICFSLSDYFTLYPLQGSWASPVVQMVKNLPARQETWFRSLGWEHPLEKGAATHSSILARRIPWTEEPGTLQSMDSQRVGHDWATFTSLHFMTGPRFIHPSSTDSNSFLLISLSLLSLASLHPTPPVSHLVGYDLNDKVLLWFWDLDA